MSRPPLNVVEGRSNDVDDETRDPVATSTTKPESSHSKLDSDGTDHGILASSAELRELYETTFQHVQDNIAFAFGYGSGVFLQQDDDDDSEIVASTTKKEQKMLDLILIVQDTAKFHQANLQVNAHHYAPLFRDAARATWWQRHDTIDSSKWIRNPKVFFNFVEEPFMKYGIMELDDLGSDLTHWDSLYIGGRMHKPTAIIASTEEGMASVSKWQNHHNLPAALSTALLLSTTSQPSLNHSNSNRQEKTLSLAELYSLISSLSYTGDFRMQVGAEDPRKINKLVHSPGQMDRFHQLYHQAALQPLVEQGVLSLDMAQQTVSWNPNDPSTVRQLWQPLPLKLQHLKPTDASIFNNNKAIEGLQQALHSIVAPAARYQSFKGLWTAGISKSARYAAAKLAKGILRKK